MMEKNKVKNAQIQCSICGKSLHLAEKIRGPLAIEFKPLDACNGWIRARDIRRALEDKPGDGYDNWECECGQRELMKTERIEAAGIGREDDLSYWLRHVIQKHCKYCPIESCNHRDNTTLNGNQMHNLCKTRLFTYDAIGETWEAIAERLWIDPSVISFNYEIKSMVTVKGKVWDYPDGEIGLNIDGFDGRQYTPITTKMPGWLFTLGTRFSVKIPRSCVRGRTIEGVIWRDFQPLTEEATPPHYHHSILSWNEAAA